MRLPGVLYTTLFMNKQLLLCTHLIAGLSLLAPRVVLAQQVAAVQAPKVTFGKPEPADFEAKNFVADSAASAVVLYDFGSTRFAFDGEDFKLDTDHVTRIKILKKSGFDYATFEIPLYHKDQNDEKITSLKGFTYNEVGGKIEKVKLDVSQAFTEERTRNVKVRKVTLPGVRVGSVIDLSYSTASDFMFNFQSWTFQRDIPTRWSEFHAVIPEYFDYKMLMQGYQPLALQQREDQTAQYTLRVRGYDTGTSGLTGSSGRQPGSIETVMAKAVSYRWAMQNVPALREEPYMTTTDDYVSRISFELAGEKIPGQGYHVVAGTWQGMQRELLADDLFGGQLDRAGFLEASIKPLIAKYPDPAARAAAVRELILRAVKYDGTSTYRASNSVKRIYDLHRGNAADVNLLLLAALRQAELEALPVLLSTRRHGRVNEYSPMLDQFNYVVALLPLPDNKQLLLDATEPMLPAGMLPMRCLNQLGRVIPANSSAEGRWVSLSPSQRQTQYQDVKLTLDAQGNIVGQAHCERGGYAGVVARSKLGELGEKKYVTELASAHPGWEIGTYKFAQPEDVSQALTLNYEWKQPANTSGTANELYLNPLQAFGEQENPFQHEQRLFPVDMGMGLQNVVRVTVTLPPGYVAELPKPATLALPDGGGRYLFSATAPTPGTVLLTSYLTLAKPVYGADEYASLREFYRLVLAKQAEALVVKKGS